MVSPFTTAWNGTQRVDFGDVSCATWATAGQCLAPSLTPYHLLVQVIGGDNVTSGMLCITSLAAVL